MKMEKNFAHLRKKRKRDKKKKKLARKVIVLHKLDWLEKISFVISFWFMFYPYPYVPLLLACLFLPLFGIYLNGLKKASFVSLIEITVENEVDVDFEMADFISFPSMAIMLRVLLDFHFDFWHSLAIPSALTVFLFMTVLYYLYITNNYPQTRKFWVYASIIVNLSLYIFSASFAVNAVFDNSKAIEYKTEVLKKKISISRSFSNNYKRKSYEIYVKAWNDKEKTVVINVSKRDYNIFQIGSNLYIYSYKGLLNIPWYSYSYRKRYALSK